MGQASAGVELEIIVSHDVGSRRQLPVFTFSQTQNYMIRVKIMFSVIVSPDLSNRRGDECNIDMNHRVTIATLVGNKL